MTEKFAVFFRGGSLGEQQRRTEPTKVFETNEEAKNYAKRMRAHLSVGEKKYYRMTYIVVKYDERKNGE